MKGVGMNEKTITKEQFEQLQTDEHTRHIVQECCDCGVYCIYLAAHSDGKSCASCGGFVIPRGYIIINSDEQ